MAGVRTILIPSGPGEATARIQQAVDRAIDGPVRVVLEPGKHRSGGIRLHSHVELALSEGAELHFVADYDAYAQTEVDIVAEASNRAMIAAQDAENVTVSGKGRIVCDSAAFVIGEDAGMEIHTPAALRPRVLVIERRPHLRPAGAITDILFQDITGTMQGAVNLIAEREGGIAGVAMRNVAPECGAPRHGAQL